MLSITITSVVDNKKIHLIKGLRALLLVDLFEAKTIADDIEKGAEYSFKVARDRGIVASNLNGCCEWHYNVATGTRICFEHQPFVDVEELFAKVSTKLNGHALDWILLTNASTGKDLRLRKSAIIGIEAL